MKAAATILAALFFCAGLLQSVANGSVIANGDFETGSLSPWTTDPGPNGDSIYVVSVSGGYYGAPVSPATNGSYAVAFNGGNSDPGGTLSQTFTSTLGVTYDMQFQYATNTGTQSLAASVLGGAGPLGSETVTGNASAFQTFSFDFVGDGELDTLQFYDLPTNDTAGEDGVLDNVSITPVSVPEPSSILILALGAFGLALVAARNRTHRSELWRSLGRRSNAGSNPATFYFSACLRGRPPGRSERSAQESREQKRDGFDIGGIR